MKSQEADILIVGAGIIGLSHAYAAVKAGHKVVVVEKDLYPCGASVRNFGLVWPIGQAPGTTLKMALRSAQIWKMLAKEAGFWLKNTGSIFLGRYPEEIDVLTEFQENAFRYGYKCKLLSNNRIKDYVGDFANSNIRAALYSDTELTIDPSEAIPALIDYLKSHYNVQFHFGKAVSRIEMPYVLAGKYVWKVEKVFVCSGNVTSLLYSEKLNSQHLQHCQLQMMAGVSEKIDSSNFPAIAGGLSLIRYPSFRHCMSVDALRSLFLEKTPWALKYGINILLSSNQQGVFNIGDSHNYSNTPETYIDLKISQEILKQLDKIYHIPDLTIQKHWLGNYLQTVGGSMFNGEVEEGVTLVSGLGGSGMTLSFGLAEENLREYKNVQQSINL